MDAYAKFKGDVRIMIATDLAARGLDFDAIDIVINLNP
jgi:superfamily II DNA/RNA helicase